MPDADIPPRRIDKGVKRGPRKQYPQRSPGLERSDTGQYLPKLPSDPRVITQVLEAYVAGATFEQIAKQYQVSRQAIYAWTLGKLAPPECDALVRRALTARIAKGDEMLDNPDGAPLDVTRGREIARFSRMDYERLRPEIYGIKQQVSVDVSHHINVDLALSERAVKLVEQIRDAAPHLTHSTIEVTPDQSDNQ